jgi:hypothetical protein
MKAISLFITLSLFGFSVFAGSTQPQKLGSLKAKNKPLFFKSEKSGYVPDGHEFSLECTIYRDHYTFKKVTRRQTWLTSRRLSVPPEAKFKIAEAARGKVSYEVAPADIGDKIYRAYSIRPLQTIEVDLGSTLDSRTISTNSSPAAKILKTYIDQTCVP